MSWHHRQRSFHSPESDEDPFLEDLRGWAPRGLFPGGGGHEGGGGPRGGRGRGGHHRGGHHDEFPPPPPPHGEHRGARGFHGGAGPRGRVFAPGDLRLLILSLMEDQPRHGYEIIKAIEDLFNGAYAPAPERSTPS